MSKQAAERRLDDNEASAFLRAIRTSPRKLNLVAQMIRGKNAATALAELTFSRRRIAHEVKMCSKRRLPMPRTITSSMSTGSMSRKRRSAGHS